MFQDSLDCFQTAISIYDKIQMHVHLQFAMADYLLSQLMVKIEEQRVNQVIENTDEENVSHPLTIIEANENLFSDIVSPNSRSSGA
jgi:hypothetical protein